MTNNLPKQPKFEPEMLSRLTALASDIDGCPESNAIELISEFNSIAGTTLKHAEFQYVYESQDHLTFVTALLTRKYTPDVESLSRGQLIDIFRITLDNIADDAYLEFVFTIVEKCFGDSQICDLIFSPGSYFGDGDDSRQLSPEEMADAVLKRSMNRPRLPG